MTRPDRERRYRTWTSLDELAQEPWMAPSRDGLVVHACRAPASSPGSSSWFATRWRCVRSRAPGWRSRSAHGCSRGSGCPGSVNVPVAGAAPRRQLYALFPPVGAHRHADLLVDALRIAAR